MTVWTPPGTISNYGAFDKNLRIRTKQVDGYTVYAGVEGKGRQEPDLGLGGFIFNAIVEDSILALGGGAIMATETGIRLARLAALVGRGVAAGAKVAKTAAQGTKLAKNTAKAIKTARTAAGKAKTAVKNRLPKTPEAARREIYKAQGYKEYVETKADKELFSKLHQFEANNPEFKDVLDRVYESVKRGAKQGVKIKNQRLRAPNPGWDYTEENENALKYVFNQDEITEEDEPEIPIQTARDYFYKLDQIQNEREKKWREEGKATFSQPTFTDEEKLANEKRQADIDRENKLLAMQLTGRDENWNYILPTKENLTPKPYLTPTVNTHVNTQVNTQRNTQVNTQVNTQTNTQKKYQSSYIDNRDYSNFNFGNNRPTIDNDWLNVNSNNVNNIDSEKLQNFVENQ